MGKINNNLCLPKKQISRKINQKSKSKKVLIVQKMDNQTVIFDADQSVLYTFNETASVIFDKLKEKMGQRKNY
ncbi:MAG: hypothetical protein KatS3mg092_0423 [Patescibacteria group bacterium]|nr:MAG: hypothetical protein KatS3mg092_0423 [Patescibacteria group bacterium]